MKTGFTAMTMLSLCAALGAQPAPSLHPAATSGTSASPSRKVTRVMDPAALSNMLAKTGGILQTPVLGPSVLFLNTQKRVPASVVHDALASLNTLLRLSFSYRDKPSVTPVADAVSVLSDTNVAAVIVIGDAEGYPSLLVAPESRWALVNVAALAGSGVSAEILSERVRKETLRAFGYVMGAANSTSESCLMRFVMSPADLDAIQVRLFCPEPLNKFLAQAKKLGVTQARRTTYRKAVEEGWAPAPTNDFQRTIWNELKK